MRYPGHAYGNIGEHRRVIVQEFPSPPAQGQTQRNRPSKSTKDIVGMALNGTLWACFGATLCAKTAVVVRATKYAWPWHYVVAATERYYSVEWHSSRAIVPRPAKAISLVRSSQPPRWGSRCSKAGLLIASHLASGRSGALEPLASARVWLRFLCARSCTYNIRRFAKIINAPIAAESKIRIGTINVV
jgi:hypothetical protein